MRFCLKGNSPTFYQLSQHLLAQGCVPTRFPWFAHFNHQHFEFDPIAAQTLEFKHLLVELLQKQYAHLIPLSFCINDKNWPQVLTKIAKHIPEDLIWILKPALLNNGQHIHIFQGLEQIKAHYLKTQRLGGEHVLQRYLTKPHLLKGHKYSIRVFVILTNYAGAYLYPYGYFNVARLPYKTAFDDLRPHLTNEHLSEEETNVIQIPTQGFDFFPAYYQQIKNILSNTLSALAQKHAFAFTCRNKRRLSVFGFDFMATEQQQLYLLEANHGPCFPIHPQHPLQHYLYDDFWRNFIKSFVLPIAKKQMIKKIEYHAFERLLF